MRSPVISTFRLLSVAAFVLVLPAFAAAPAFWHPDLDALRELEALVSGEAPFDIADSDEFIEGRVLPGVQVLEE